MGTSSRGAALIDVIFTCGVIAIIGAMAIPTLQATRDRDAVRSAARYVSSRLHQARIEAFRRNTTVSIHFDPDDVGRMRLFVDGDGDGVSQRDIDDGIDPPLGPDVHINTLFSSVSLQITSDIPEPDGDGRLTRGGDPLRIGSSNLLSFGPLGGATSGTIYVAARTGPQLCVRILGVSGRMRVLWFDTASQLWRPD